MISASSDFPTDLESGSQASGSAVLSVRLGVPVANGLYSTLALKDTTLPWPRGPQADSRDTSALRDRGGPSRSLWFGEANTVMISCLEQSRYRRGKPTGVNAWV